jgi:hypothetical protein
MRATKEFSLNRDAIQAAKKETYERLRELGVNMDDAGIGLAFTSGHPTLRVHLPEPISEQEKINQVQGFAIEYEVTGIAFAY